jgi:hypothetical protein
VLQGEDTAACQHGDQQNGTNRSFSSHCAFLPAQTEVVQQTPGKPDVVGLPEDVPIVGQPELPGRMLDGVAVGVGTAGTPLIPAFPISVEPKGIPVGLAPPGIGE